MVRIEGRQFEYTGDVDQNGNATGWGVATTPDGRFGISYSGTFVNNRLEGIITKTTETSKWIGEMHAGDAHGRSTQYSASDTPTNEVRDCHRYYVFITVLRKANCSYQNFNQERQVYENRELTLKSGHVREEESNHQLSRPCILLSVR